MESDNNYADVIDAMVKQFLYMSEDADTSAWSVVCNQTNPPLQVHKLDSAENCFKVIAQLGSSPEAAFDILSDITRRTEWDDLCEEGHIIERINGSTKIQYMKTKGIIMK